MTVRKANAAVQSGWEWICNGEVLPGNRTRAPEVIPDLGACVTQIYH